MDSRLAAQIEPYDWISYVGYPLLLVVHARGGWFEIKVEWGMLADVLAGAWLISMPLGRLVTPAERSVRSRPAFLLGAWATAALVIAFFIAIGASKWYWGYFLSPPGIEKRVLNA